ncbi:MAG: DUF1648 domain-containing protein [Negativibacillus sp.]
MKALHRIFVALTCFPVVLSLLLLPLLPERIPAHYNLYGEVDRWEAAWRFCCCRCAALSAVCSGGGSLESCPLSSRRIKSRC